MPKGPVCDSRSRMRTDSDPRVPASLYRCALRFRGRDRDGVNGRDGAASAKRPHDDWNGGTGRGNELSGAPFPLVRGGQSPVVRHLPLLGRARENACC